MAYLSSDKVHIFPCANRAANKDIESKINTEYNLINLPSALTTNKSFTISKTNNKIIFILHGYYVEADFTDSTIGISGSLYADCKTYSSALTSSQSTLALGNYETSNSFDLDVEGEFRGINFETNETTGYFQILNDGELVNNQPFSIDNLGDIINNYSATTNGITVTLTQTDGSSGKLNIGIESSKVTNATNADYATSASKVNNKLTIQTRNNGSYEFDGSGAVTVDTKLNAAGNAGSGSGTSTVLAKPVYIDNSGNAVALDSTSVIGNASYPHMVVVTDANGEVTGNIQAANAANVTTYIQSRAITIKTLTLTPTTGTAETYNLVCVADESV